MKTLRETLEDVELLRLALKNLEGPDPENWKKRDIIKKQLLEIYAISDWYSARCLAAQILGFTDDKRWQDLKGYITFLSLQLTVDRPQSLVGAYESSGVWQYPTDVIREFARQDLKCMYKYLPTKLEKELVGDVLGYSMLSIKMRENPVLATICLIFLVIFMLYFL